MPLDEDKSSDIGEVWREALEKYLRDTKIDLQSMDRSKWSISVAIAEQERQLQEFSDHRHDGGKIDRLRSLLARNSDIIQGLASQVASAASAAFPPSSAILTAFTYVMKASKVVSDDYDVIITFFDLFNSCLERLALLESKMPTEPTYKVVLMRVFGSILDMCAIAHNYRKKGRFVAWAKAMYKGNDSALKSSYDDLLKHVQRLESASLMVTLATSIEISRSVQTMSVSLDETKEYVLEASKFAKDGAQTSHKTLEAVKVLGTGLEALRRKLGKELRDGKSLLEAAASSKSALAEIKRVLQSGDEEYPKTKALYQQMKLEQVEGTLDWLKDDNNYQAFVGNQFQVLWVEGSTGMGKSMLLVKLISNLHRDFENDTDTFITYWFPRKPYMYEGCENIDYLKYALEGLVIQIAEKSALYCMDVLSIIQSVRYLNENEYWTRLFLEQFSNESGRRLIIIIDDVDDLNGATLSEEQKQDKSTLHRLIDSITGTNVRIQIACSSKSSLSETITTTRTRRTHEELVQATPSRKPTPSKETLETYQLADFSGGFNLNIPINRNDFRLVISHWCQSNNRLSKLQPAARNRIANTISERADGFEAVILMLQHLSQCGRGLNISRELDRFHGNASELSEVLIDEYQKRKATQSLDAMMRLFCWLSYHPIMLTLEGAYLLIDVVAPDSGIDIEEEVHGRLSSILCVKKIEDDTVATYDEDAEVVDLSTLVIGFRNSTVESYFRSPFEGTHVLRCSPDKAPLVLFETMSLILTSDAVQPVSHGWKNWRLLGAQAVSSWVTSFMKIRVETLDDDEVVRVVTLFFEVVSNKNGSLAKFEEWAPTAYLHDPATTIFNELIYVENEWIFSNITYYQKNLRFGDIRERLLDTIAALAARASSLGPGAISQQLASWIGPLANEPMRVFLTLARRHLENFISISNSQSFQSSFYYAHCALFLSRDDPLISSSVVLKNHFESYHLGEDLGITEEVGVAIINIFSDIAKVQQSHRHLAHILMHQGRNQYREAAISQLKYGLSRCTDQVERLKCLVQLSWCTVEWINHAVKHDSVLDEVRVARELLDEALAIQLPSSIEASISKHPSICEVFVLAYYQRAWCAWQEGNLAECVDAIEKRTLRGIGLDWEDSSLFESLIDEDDKSFAFKLLKLFEPADRAYLILRTYRFSSRDDKNTTLQRAAHTANQLPFLLQVYRETFETFRSQMDFQSRAHEEALAGAKMCLQVMKSNEALNEARKLLRQVLDSDLIEGHGFLETSACLADVIYRDYVLHPDLQAKSACYKEMIDIVDNIALRKGKVHPTHSKTQIPFLRMTRKLRGALEFHDRLQETFEACITGLDGDTDVDDQFQDSFKLLAKLLSFFPSLAYDAQIAASCQIYNKRTKSYLISEQVNPIENDEVQELEKNSEHGGVQDARDDDNDDEYKAQNGEENPKSDGESETDVDHEDENDEYLESEENEIYWKGLDCADCSKYIKSWREAGPIYICCHCVDCLLCEECYTQRWDIQSGNSPPAWRTICPDDHTYIKAPVGGWSTMKNGEVMIIDEQEIFLSNWIKTLKEIHWPKALAEYLVEDS